MADVAQMLTEYQNEKGETVIIKDMNPIHLVNSLLKASKSLNHHLEASLKDEIFKRLYEYQKLIAPK